MNKRLQEISSEKLCGILREMFEPETLPVSGSAVAAVSVCYRRESHARTSRTSPFIRVKT
jgi:seryl-tRNA synthetase